MYVQVSALDLGKESQEKESVGRSAEGQRQRHWGKAPVDGREKAKTSVKEIEKEQKGGRTIRMPGEERVANRVG